LRQPYRSARNALPVVLTVAEVMASGCASLSEHKTPASLPPPPLQLISAGDLELPRDCRVRDGVVYRTNFVVGSDGRVAAIHPEPAPACLQTTLATWLGTIQYAPPGKAVATTIDWMGVTARRGD
jgi:hypothetical protein